MRAGRATNDFFVRCSSTLVGTPTQAPSGAPVPHLLRPYAWQGVLTFCRPKGYWISLLHKLRATLFV
jgi:hypothetical protein